MRSNLFTYFSVFLIFSDVSESFSKNSFSGESLGFKLAMHDVFSYVVAFIATNMFKVKDEPFCPSKILTQLGVLNSLFGGFYQLQFL